MSVTLDQILTLSGRLDDSSGFDAARERFRRFLLEHVADLRTARALIEQCQHAPTEQHRRALQDLVVLLGRFLGFQVTCGVYEPSPDAIKYHGHWRSLSHLHVVVEVRTDQTPGVSVETLARAVTALADETRGSQVRAAGLSVLTPLAANRQKITAAIAAARRDTPIAVLTLPVLLSVAEMVVAGRMTHDDVVRVIESHMPVEFIVDLLERAGGSSPAPEPDAAHPSPPPASAHAAPEHGFWVATIAADQATTPEQWLELVVGQRHIFGIAGNAAAGPAPTSGDRICFYIPGRGIVGNGRVRALASGSTGIRDAERFRQILHLDGVELHLHTPIALDFESQLKLRSGPAAGRSAQALVKISQESFTAMISPREESRTERPVRRSDRGGPRTA